MFQAFIKRGIETSENASQGILGFINASFNPITE